MAALLQAECPSTYIDLYTKARCGKVEYAQKLEDMNSEGDPLAKGYLAMLLHRSPLIIIPKDRARAAKLLTELYPWMRQVENDDRPDVADIWYLLGFCHYESVGGVPDRERSIHYYQLAFNKNHSLAQCALGNCYDMGDFVKKSLPRAVSYYKMSADQGFPVAQCNYAMCKEYGDGCEVNLEEAVQYAKLAADQGYVDAMYCLFVYYFYGKGVEPDRVKAVQYGQAGAALGDLECIYVVGGCYLRGDGVDWNAKKGFSILLDGANRNHDLCVLEVALCYKDGWGVERNITECVRYLRRFLVLLSDKEREVDVETDLETNIEIATKTMREVEVEYKEEVWQNRRNFLLFLACYQFLHAAEPIDHPAADNYTHTSFSCQDICYTISSFL